MIKNSKCLICGKDFYSKPSHKKLGWGKYCSRTCTNKSQLKGKYFKCSICGKSVYKSPKEQKHSVSGKFFCSKSCQTLWRNSYFIEERSVNWKNGEKSYRNILKRSKNKPICILCGINNEVVLAAHHKDHNRLNNSLENLVWLCLNCHFLVHHDDILDQRVRNWK